MDIVLFIYGLSFFVLGVLIFFATPKNSELFFANKIWLIGVFAILYAMTEWISFYAYIKPYLKEILIPLEALFLLLSYLFLFEFSRFIVRKSFENPHSKLHFIYHLYAKQIIYPMSFIVFGILIALNSTLSEIMAAIRYTYGFWGSLFLGIGLYFYGDSLKKIHQIHRLKYYFQIAGITFVCYAFFAGIIVSPAKIFPANIINETLFLEIFHLPVQVFRFLCALIFMIMSTKILEIFSNELIEKLHDSFEHIKEFNANASHQLKTPLAAIKVQIDVTLEKTREVDEYQSILHSIGEEVSSQQKLVTNLLLLTRMEDDTIKKHFIDISLDAILLEVVGEYMVVANQKKIHLEIQNLDEITIQGDETLMHILMTNLIDNAIKYTPSGKTITLSLQNSVLSVTDEGIGIQSDKIPMIFNKFFQVDTSKKTNLKSYGLGLPMVKKIVDLHKGSIYVKSEIGIGTTISVRFG